MKTGVRSASSALLGAWCLAASSLALTVAANSPAHLTAKDIVLASMLNDQGTAEAAAAASSEVATNLGLLQSDGLVVSVLSPAPAGTWRARSVDAPFRTGERFRVKVLSRRDGEIAFYNTNPSGKTSASPLLLMAVRRGVEVVTEEFLLTGGRGEDQLHIVLVPSAISAEKDGVSAQPAVAASSTAPPNASVSTSVSPPAPADRSTRLARLGTWVRQALSAQLGADATAKSSPLTHSSTGQATYATAPNGDGIALTVRIRHE